MTGLDVRLGELLTSAAASFDPDPAARLSGLRARLGSPLRVAVVGRVKAGKSTLLNALVGERLAPTDAGECTKLVTTYTYDDAYRVRAEAADGSLRDLQFKLEDGRLAIEVTSDAQALSVGWPARRLRQMTLIDTPGLESIEAGVGERTEAGLLEDDRSDAAIYLMRHLHRSDIHFLEAFGGRGGQRSSPISSVAVLSRADEIGASRLDALESARNIAARLKAEERLRSVASSVVPVAGLLAETAVTLEEREAAALRQLAAAGPAELQTMLLSVDYFRTSDAGPLTVELREHLLQRFGMFGVRLAVHTSLAGQWETGSDLARLILRESGLPELDSLVTERFAGRARNLVVRSVVSALRRLLEQLGATNSAAQAVLHELEALEASAHEFAEMEMLDLVLGGEVELLEAERKDAERVTLPGPPATRLGLPPDSSPEVLRAAAVAGVQRWRERGAQPLAGRALAFTANTLARTYEGLYASVETVR